MQETGYSKLLVRERKWATSGEDAYYLAMRSELVETEDALKAGHVVEPVSGMHCCAKVTEVEDASNANNNGFLMAGVLILDRMAQRRS
jgi:hypothetical protein